MVSQISANNDKSVRQKGDDIEDTNPILRGANIVGSSALAGAVGLPGDIESTVRSGLGLVSDKVSQDTILPTSSQLLERGRSAGKIATPRNKTEEVLAFGGSLFGAALTGGALGRTASPLLKGKIPKASAIVAGVPKDIRPALTFAAGGAAIEAGGRALDLSPTQRAAAQLVLPMTFRYGLKKFGIKPSPTVPKVKENLQKIVKESFTKTRKFKQPLDQKGINNFSKNWPRIIAQADRLKQAKGASPELKELIDSITQSTSGIAFGRTATKGGLSSITKFRPSTMFANYKDLNEEISRVTKGKDTGINELFTNVKNVTNRAIKEGGGQKALDEYSSANQANMFLQELKKGEANLASVKPDDLHGKGLVSTVIDAASLFIPGPIGHLLKAARATKGFINYAAKTKQRRGLETLGKAYKLLAKTPELQKEAVNLIEATNASDFSKKDFISAMKSFSEGYENALLDETPVKIFVPRKRKKKDNK